MRRATRGPERLRVFDSGTHASALEQEFPRQDYVTMCSRYLSSQDKGRRGHQTGFFQFSGIQEVADVLAADLYEKDIELFGYESLSRAA